MARLVGGDDFKLRVVDHRVLAVMSYPEKTVFIGRVGHRSTIYDRR